MNPSRALLISLFDAAIQAVSGERTVSKTLAAIPGFKPDKIIAVGKAASQMAAGALHEAGSIDTLIVTKYQHCDLTFAAPHITVHESAHPIPDENSLKAGRVMVDWVDSMRSGERLLFLVSGGASAVAEVLPDGVSLEQWQQMTAQMIASGKTIAQINQKRKQLSLIKDGKLLQRFKGREVLVLVISDVEGDDISTIGSGIGDSRRCCAVSQTHLIATNKIARDAVVQAACRAGVNVQLNFESLYDDVFRLAVKIGELVKEAQPGLYIFGGEPTIELPENPGDGGRNQSLALALAEAIAGRVGITILIAGTDGSDGPTDAAGAIVDGSSFADPHPAQLALNRADAGSYLRQCGDIFVTGPTGTNVMDLVLILVK